MRADSTVKSRLVARDFNQGDRPTEKFASTPQLVSLRALLAVTSVEMNQYRSRGSSDGASNIILALVDVHTAFLHASMEEPVLVRAPEEARASPESPKWWLPRKALYGYRRAPRLWADHLAAILQDLGMLRLRSDPSVFVTTDRRVRLLVHVDDLAISGPQDRVTGFDLCHGELIGSPQSRATSTSRRCARVLGKEGPEDPARLDH